MSNKFTEIEKLQPDPSRRLAQLRSMGIPTELLRQDKDKSYAQLEISLR